MSQRAPGVAPETHAAPALERWLTWHAIAMIAGACGAVISRRSAYVAVPALISFALLWRGRPPELPALRRGVGLANGLTALRLSVVLLATASMPRLGTAWVMAAFSLNVVLDAIDGYSARRLGAATSFGALFDREVDAVFVLSAYLYFHLYSIGGLGPWVLLPGVLPYLYRLSVAALSAPVPSERKERLAAPLAAVNFVLLLGAVGLPAYATPILAVSVSVVLLSFSASFWSLYRHAYSFSQ